MCLIIPLSTRGCETGGLVCKVCGVDVVLMRFEDIVTGNPVEEVGHTSVGALGCAETFLATGWNRSKVYDADRVYEAFRL